MVEVVVQVTPELPLGFSLEMVVRFFPEYSLRHPLSFSFGSPTSTSPTT